MARSVRKFKETVEIRSWKFKRLQSHRYFPVVVISAVVLLACCVHVWQRVTVLRLVKEVSALKKENVDLVDVAKKLHSDIAALSISTRIEKYAADSLGLKPVDGDRLYTLIPESSADISTDELTTMLSSIKRVARFLPVLSETQATAGELEAIKFDETQDEGSQR